MEHGLELISPRLEILEIEVFNIIYNPGNIGNLIFLIFSYPGNIGNWIFLIAWYPGNTGNWFFWLPGILEIRAAGGRRRAGGSRGCVVLPWIIFGTCFLEFPDILEILEICFFYILGFFQKRRAPKFHAEWSGFRGEISHMRPIQGQKLKLFQPPILPLFFPSSKPLATTMFLVAWFWFSDGSRCHACALSH